LRFGFSNAVGQMAVGESLHLQRVSTDQLPAYALAQYRVWEPELLLAVAFDASRLGRPLEDTMLFALQNGVDAAWGAPMVPCGVCNAI
jgi:hypothetical protein